MYFIVLLCVFNYSCHSVRPTEIKGYLLTYLILDCLVHPVANIA